jgi:hypothetical protein
MTNHLESMAIPIKFSSNGDILETTTAYKCREQICDEFIDALLYPTKSNKIDASKVLNKARLIVYKLSDYEISNKHLKQVLKPIRLLEKECKLPRTQIKKLTCNWQDGNYIMFEGSNKWYRSSHTMSLWHLLIRFGMLFPGNLEVNNFAELKKLIKTFPEHPGTSGCHWFEEDQGSMRETIDIWVPLMTNLNKVFPPGEKWTTRYNNKKQHIKPTLDSKNNGDYGYLRACYREGILMLAKGESLHKHSTSLKQFLKKEG